MRKPKAVKRLFKRHHACPNRGDLAACRCAWKAKYKDREITLATWCGKQVDPRLWGPAEAVLRRFMTAVDEKHFDPAGELPPLGSGQLFGEFCEEWRHDYAIPEGLSLSSIGRPENLRTGDKGCRGTVDVVKASRLGRMTLEEIAGGSAVIYKWLNDEAEEREWTDKTWTEYHGLLNRICHYGTRLQRGGKAPMASNPMDQIDRRSFRKPKHFQRRVLLEDVEDRLFAVVHQLDRPQHLPNRNKLTQEQADTIRAEKEKGTLQKDLAREYRVSESVISSIVNGQIWNPAKYKVGTKGREMCRRLMIALDCGVRPGEMLLIQIKHVDWRHPRRMTARDGTEFNAYQIVLPAENTKGGKWTGEDEVVIAGTLRLSQELEARRFQLKNNPDAYMFGTEEGRYQASFDKMWQALFELAGLDWGRDKGLVWYTTRSENISRVVENSNDPMKAQKAARHADLKTTQGYMHARQDSEWEVAVGLDRTRKRG